MPVTIAPQLIPPYSLQLSSYYQGASPRLVVTLINNDLSRPGLRVKLNMSIKGRSSGVNIQTAPTANSNTFILESGIPVPLNLNDLMTLFNVNNLQFSGGMTALSYQQKGMLPEDIYDFCFEAFEATTGERLSNLGCATAYITFSEPPLLNNPQKGGKVKITEPSNIPFSWTPRHRPNATEPTEYTFQIVEINNTIQGGKVNQNITNPEAAFTQQKILFEQKTSSTSIIYGPSAPMLIPGKMYAWRVKAENISTNEDKSIFRNGGYSEISYFNAVPNCQEIGNIISNTQPDVFSLTWIPIAGINSYTVSYRKLGSNLPWLTMTTNTPSAYISQLDAGEQYEYTVSFNCGSYPVTTVPRTITIAKPMAISGKVDWKLNKTAYDKQSQLANIVTNSKTIAIDDDKELKGSAASVGSYGIVKISFYVEQSLVDSVMLRTDKDGNYKAEFPKSVINHSKFVSGKKEVVVSAHMQGHTIPKSDTFKFTAFNKNDLKSNLTLRLNTLHLEFEQVLGSEGQLQENIGGNTSTSFEIFVTKQYYDQHLQFLQNKLIGTSIQYNGDEYLLLAKETPTKSKSTQNNTVFSNLPKLNNEKYLLRLTAGRTVQYEKIEDIHEGQSAMQWWLQNQNKKLVIKRSPILRKSFDIQGNVTYNSINKANQVVTLLVKNGSTTIAEVSSNTDSNGRYDIRIPNLEQNLGTVSHELFVRDHNNRLNNVNAPTVKIDINTHKEYLITQNFDFDFGRTSIIGRLVDENNKPISNVLVKATGKDNTPYANTTTNEYGFYTFNIPCKLLEVNMSFESENTKTHTETIVWKRGEGKGISVSTWKQTINNYSEINNPQIKAQADISPAVFGIHGINYEDAYNHIAGSEYIVTDLLKQLYLKKRVKMHVSNLYSKAEREKLK